MQISASFTYNELIRSYARTHVATKRHVVAARTLLPSGMSLLQSDSTYFLNFFFPSFFSLLHFFPIFLFFLLYYYSITGFVNQSNNIAIAPGSSFPGNANGHKSSVWVVGGGMDGGPYLQMLLTTEGKNIKDLDGYFNVVRNKNFGLFETIDEERVNVGGNKLRSRIRAKHVGSSNPRGSDPNQGSNGGGGGGKKKKKKKK